MNQQGDSNKSATVQRDLRENQQGNFMPKGSLKGELVNWWTRMFFIYWNSPINKRRSIDFSFLLILCKTHSGSPVHRVTTQSKVIFFPLRTWDSAALTAWAAEWWWCLVGEEVRKVRRWEGDGWWERRAMMQRQGGNSVLAVAWIVETRLIASLQGKTNSALREYKKETAPGDGGGVNNNECCKTLWVVKHDSAKIQLFLQ